jgi:hypothetical protein
VNNNNELSRDWNSSKYEDYFACVRLSKEEQTEGMKFVNEKFNKDFALEKKAKNGYEIWASEYICDCIMRHLIAGEGEK